MTDDQPTERSEPGRPTGGTELTYPIDESERPSLAVVRAVASVTNTPVLDLDPIYDTIDPDYLDGVDETPVEDSSITFSFNGCQVTVTQDEVHVQVQTADPRH